MAGFDQSFIEEVRRNNDLVDYVSEYLALQKRGKNYFGLCPFHEEDTPSFSVSPDKQLFYCFGCQEGGDLFDFAMRMEGLEFREAVELLAERAGLSVPEDGGGESKRYRRRKFLYKVLSFANRYYQRALRSEKVGGKARRYLEGRGITQEEVERHGLGYAPRGWDNILKLFEKRGVGHKPLLAAGLIVPRDDGQGYYDRFRDRLMFPIYDVRGRTIGFGGRVLDDGQPKYLNSPETELFNKREVWYGLERAKRAISDRSSAIIVEGYTDVIAAHSLGFPNTVASLGTALNRRQVRVLSRYADEVIMAYDADEAGMEAALKGLQLFFGRVERVKVLNLPAGKDPDDLLRERGEDFFGELIENASPLMRYCFDWACSQHDIDTVSGKSAVTEAIAPWLYGLRDEVARDAWIKRFAAELDISEEAFRRELGRRGPQGGRNSRRWDINRRERYNNTEKADSEEPGRENESFVGLTSRTQAEHCLLALMLDSPPLVDDINREGGIDIFADPVARQVAQRIFELWEKEGFLKISQILNGLTDSKPRRLVTAIEMEELQFDSEERALEDCLKTIERHNINDRLEKLHQKIVQKERKGLEIPSELLKEYDVLSRRLKGKPLELGDDSRGRGETT